MIKNEAEYKFDEAAIRGFSDTFAKMEAELSSVIVGQKDIVRNVLAALVCGGNVLLEGLPGLGKTQMIKAVGKITELSFSRIQFTPDLMPSDVTGTDIYVKQNFEFRKGPIFANLVLADEINRATPKTQSALLEAMQEQTVTAGGTTYDLPRPFFVLATQNPLEMEGTYPLPEAQMDRFMMKLNVGTPSADELARIVKLTTSGQSAEPSKVIDAAGLLAMRAVARDVAVSEQVLKFTSELVTRTHPGQGAASTIDKYVRYGASPRGAQALMLAGKVTALLNGRFNLSYDDVKELARPVLRHRLFLNYEAMSDGVSADDVIGELLAEM